MKICECERKKSILQYGHGKESSTGKAGVEMGAEADLTSELIIGSCDEGRRGRACDGLRHRMLG